MMSDNDHEQSPFSQWRPLERQQAEGAWVLTVNSPNSKGQVTFIFVE